jgi:hypothetical protein
MREPRAQSRIEVQIGKRGDRRERRVEARIGAHQAQAVGPEDAQAVRARRSEHRLLQRLARGAGLAESAAQHHGGTQARGPGFRDQAGERMRRGNEDRGLRRLRQVAETRVAALPEHLGVLGIDRAQRAAQPAGGQVLPHQPAEGAFALGGADQRHAGRSEQRGEGVAEHGCKCNALSRGGQSGHVR